MIHAEDVAWAGFWVGFGLLDYAASKHGASLCDSARRLARTDTRPGRAVIYTGLIGGAVVLARHVCKR